MAYSPRINSKQGLKDYIMRALGSPVLQINIADVQIEDRIDDAIELFWQYHADGVRRVYYKHQVTQEDIDNNGVTLPKNIMSVLRVMPVDGQDVLAINNLQYVMYITDIMDVRRFNGQGLSTYANTMSYLNTIQDLFGYDKVIEFNMHDHFLEVQTDWTLIKVNDWFIVEAYVFVDPTAFGDTWNNYWLKQYAVALCKKQWGWNIWKFLNNVLPGGVQINGEGIYNEGKADVKDLEDRLRDEFEEPISFFMG